MNASPTIEQIHRHASVRSYRPDPVPVDQVEAIVAAGQRSSTSSNLQMFSVVAVTEQSTRERLAVLCGNQEHIAQAPVFLAWCADLARLDRACQVRGYEQVTQYVESFLLAAVDTSLAMQNAALAAELMGLGICYIGAIRNRPQEVIDLLELPRLVFPIAGMTLGWPAVEPMLRPRLPLSAVLHWERYDRSRAGRGAGRVRPGHGCHWHLRRPASGGARQGGRNGGLRLDRTLGPPRLAAGPHASARGVAG